MQNVIIENKYRNNKATKFELYLPETINLENQFYLHSLNDALNTFY